MADGVLTFPHFEPHFPRDQWALPHVLEHQARVRPDKPCLQWTDEGRKYSFAEVNAMANQLARGFQKLGVKKGDYVVIFMPNALEYVLAWYALAKLGAIEVTVGESYKGEILRHQVGLAQPRIILTTPALSERLAAIEDQIGHAEHVILAGEGEAAPFRRITTSRFADLYEEDDSNPGIEVGPRDTAAVLFTSGTTGLSKGVLMSHSQF